MWPYTECEWNYITHGKKNNKIIKRNKIRQFKTLIWMSVVPSAVLVWILSLII